MNALNQMRLQYGKALIAFLWINCAVVAITAMTVGGGLAAASGAFLLTVSATVVWRSAPTGLETRIVTSIAAAGLVSTLVYAMAGTPLQIDMHMYFFATLAVCAGWCDWRPLVAFALVTATHHLLLNYAYPAAVFPANEPSLSRVLFHAAILVVQTAMLSVICIRIEQLFFKTETALETANAAESQSAALLCEQHETTRAGERRRRDLEALVDGFSTEVSSLLSVLRRQSADLDGRSTTLADLSSSASLSATRAAQRAEEASMDVDAMAAATEEIAVSTEAMGMQVAMTTSLIASARSAVIETSRAVSLLATEARSIGEVVDIIQNIANQTNMLALNATIEAARAGESGRGFSVVAVEVKKLADQTSRATDEITNRITGIARETNSAAQSIDHFAARMGEVSTLGEVVASAVQQQQAVTTEISRSAQSVASGTKMVTEISRGSDDVAQQTSEAAARIKIDAQDMLKAATELEARIQSFIRRVAA